MIVLVLLVVAYSRKSQNMSTHAASADYVGERLEEIWDTVQYCEDGDVPMNLEASIRAFENPLVQAAILQDHRRIESLLNGGMDINSVEPQDTVLFRSWTPLMAAIYVGSIPTARLLLDAGADPGMTDRYGNTLAHIAAGALVSSDVLSFAIELVGTEAIHMENRVGETLAFRATADDCHGPAKLRFLAERGADLGVPCSDGYTPLSLAKEYGHEENIATLKELLGINE